MNAQHRWTVLLLCALAGASSNAQAQSIGGRVVSAADRQPITHALVVALDEAGRQVGGVLSDSAGRFVLRVPAPGRYTVRAERIGYESVTSALLSIDAAFHAHDVVLAERPFLLRGVRAEVGGRGCSRRDGADVVALWTEIQKALRLTMFTDARAALTYTTLQYTRELDPDLAKVEREQQTYRSGRATAPFGALTPAELMANGFSRATGEETELLGLDARVLLSPEFVENYCFRVRASARPQNLIGLGFEPIRRRRGTDVRGVLWVDRNSAELRYLAYEYLQLPAHLATYDARSEVHFRRLNTGLWVVERWWIRTPRLAAARSPFTMRIDQTYELIGYREDGGVLLAAADAQAATYHLIGGAGLTGRITGRTAATTRGRTTVLLSGTPHAATAEAAGDYRIVGIPPGTYALAARDSLLDELRMPVRLDSVRLVSGRTTTHDYAWPTQPEILRALCPREEEETMARDHGLLYGDVVDPDTRRPIAGAEVRVAWRALDASSGMDRWRTATTGSDGRYYVCWLAIGVEVNVRVTAPATATRAFQLELVSPIQRRDVR